MFNRKKTQKPSLTERIESGNLSIEAAQQILNLRKVEAEVNDTEHTARDHSNLVDLRSTWGRVILAILVTTILSDFFLVWMVGSGKWEFKNHDQFLNVVATEHLAQIFGLVLIVLKSLFPKNDK